MAPPVISAAPVGAGVGAVAAYIPSDRAVAAKSKEL
jgi:hypothetical protein